MKLWFSGTKLLSTSSLKFNQFESDTWNLIGSWNFQWHLEEIYIEDKFLEELGVSTDEMIYSPTDTKHLKPDWVIKKLTSIGALHCILGDEVWNELTACLNVKHLQ